MTEKTAWARNIIASVLACTGVSLATFIGAGYYFGAFTTEVKLGQAQLQAQIKDIAETTKAQVNGIAEDTKKQIENTELRLTDKIKTGAENLSTVANANQQAVNALATLSQATAISSAQNTAQDREIDDIKRSLRDLNTTLRDLNNSLRFQIPAQPTRPLSPTQ